MHNLGNIMKQAKKMQERIGQLQQELEKKTIEAQAGGGMVRVVVNGKFEIISLKIEKEVVNPEMLPALKPSAAALMINKYNDVDNLFPTFEQALTPVSQGGLDLLHCDRTPETAIREQDLTDPRICKILAILREVDAMPRAKRGRLANHLQMDRQIREKRHSGFAPYEILCRFAAGLVSGRH